MQRDHTSGVAIPYEPGLDGLRALAVIVVLCFHQGFGWAQGGFLGVSLFFTLSGYLITRLLLTEHAARGRIALGTFWARRLRRLGPALLLALAGAIVISTALTAPERIGLKGDVLASLGYVANWRLLLHGEGYAALFASPSLVQHFWSLAIEEQFYLLYPLLVAGVLAVGRGSRRVLAGVLVTLAVGSLVVTLLSSNPDRVYYGTDSRALELLAGALLALAVPHLAASRWLRSRALLGMLGAAAAAVLWTSVSLSTSWLYSGGFALVAVSSVMLLVGATTPGPVARVLSWSPLCKIGRISYGLYLFHWPIYVWLDETRTGLSGWPLFALRVTVVLVLSVLSFTLIEYPIRTGRRLRTPRFAFVVVSGVALVAASTAVAVATPREDEVIDASDFRRAAAIPDPSPVATTPTLVPSATTSFVSVPQPMRAYLVGDSTGMQSGHGLYEWGQNSGNVEVKQGALLACGLLRGAALRAGPTDLPDSLLARCNEWPERWPRDIQTTVPDVILVVMGPANTVDALLPGESQWRGLGDPKVDDLLWTEMNAAAEVLETAGVPILWFDSPYLEPGAEARVGTQADRARMDVYNDMVRRLAATHPLIVRVRWAERVGRLGDASAALRPDGVHVDEAQFGAALDDGLWAEITDDWLRVRNGEETDPNSQASDSARSKPAS